MRTYYHIIDIFITKCHLQRRKLVHLYDPHSSQIISSSEFTLPHISQTQLSDILNHFRFLNNFIESISQTNSKPFSIKHLASSTVPATLQTYSSLSKPTK